MHMGLHKVSSGHCRRRSCVLTENEAETRPVVRVADTRLYQDDGVNEDPVSEKQRNDVIVLLT